ncbi:MAG: hypothetical protein OEM66_07550 [Acidimicrobiia bacterium]|nr:hypothetical protein [Acidimicrobiia bacterium]
MSLLLISGPSGAGPGERQEMLERARQFMNQQGVEPADIVRIDVPGRGGEEGSGTLRADLEGLIPVLQSGSLFGGTQGVELIDGQNLLVGEATVVSELIRVSEGVAVAIVAEGAVHASINAAVKDVGSKVVVRKVWESGATTWLIDEIKARGLEIDASAGAALVQRFGADLAALGQALDQLADVKGKISAAAVLDRFKNRPNEPIFHYTDAVAAGKTQDALRRLGDLLVHQHPLVILASLESEVRRRSMALAAPDKETLIQMAGARASDKWVDRVWRRRGKLKDSSLRSAVDALARADKVLKSAPEEMHRVTLERLTVAVSRWLAGR